MSARDYFQNQANLIELNFRRDLLEHQEKIIELASELRNLFNEGHRIAFCGNGGSASEASHLAAEFLGKCIIPHDPLPALCLNDSAAILTAIANDFGYEEVFSRQVEGQLQKGDLLIALSTSGKSANIVRALETASRMGVRALLWTGANSIGIPNVEIWRSNHKITPRIQESHLMWGHLLVEIFENESL
jgi:D-sedoheptulose 7-phosphate isomerase